MKDLMYRDTILDVSDLTLSFTGERGESLRALDRVSFSVPRGKTLCLVGESGCGKSVTARALLRILGENAVIDHGTMRFERADGSPCDLAALDPKGREARTLRGEEIAMIYQEPMTALSPLYTIGEQIAEVLRWHRGTPRKEARARAIEMLAHVGMPAPEQRFDAYSFELSGGQRQRAVIAMALIAQPKLLIADEPTTALDVTTQAGILSLLRDLQAERDMSMIFITHDLGVVAEIADEVAVMYMGRVVEQGPVDRILSDPRHPYTQGLLASLPSTRGPRRARLSAIPGAVPHLANRPAGCAFAARCAWARMGTCDRQDAPDVAIAPGHSAACHQLDAQGYLPPLDAGIVHTPARRAPDYNARPLLRVRDLRKTFRQGGGLLSKPRAIQALNGVSFDLYPGETLGLVGESGCGKSTLGRTLMGLHPATSGAVHLREGDRETDLVPLPPAALKQAWRRIRMVFQDPNGSFNPRMTVFDIVAEVLRVQKTPSARIEARVREVLRLVGLDEGVLDRFPHAFSGGQRQRIGIARALASAPGILIADEAVSALDVSVQAQVLNLFADLQAELGLAYLFVSHDLSVVRHISDRVAVMYAGAIVELAPAETLFAAPRHPYTRTLLDAVLDPADARRDTAPHDTGPRDTGSATVPDPANLPQGCAFAARCPRASALCGTTRPALPRDAGPQDHAVACHHPLSVQQAHPLRQEAPCPA